MKKYRREFVGELLGTFLLVLFGCGTVANSVLFNSYQGIVQIALMWGIGVTLAIYATRHLCCAHLNPAVTIAMAANKRMDIKKVPVYLIAQFLGAFIAGFVIYGLFSNCIADYESVKGIVRGTPESMNVAKMFGEYYQLPGASMSVSMPVAMAAEGLGTFLLVLMIFSLTEGCNLGKPDNNLAPVFIGISVSSSICLVAPLTQAGLNPARDFGPRMAAWIFGWGKAAFPDTTGGFFFVYILSPVVGGIFAGFLFTHVIQKLMQQSIEDCCCKSKSIIRHEDMTIKNREINLRTEDTKMKSRIILIGGFLGSGKTTLLWKMAQKLSDSGRRVGLITNDQASELVDTAFLSRAGGATAEVSGSCFCCNFNGFKDAIENLRINNQADVIIAEPVGSCTDLSATIMQPLKEKYKGELDISPLNVLIDPIRLNMILNGGTSGLHTSAAYIVRKQLEEADYIVINKIDLLTQEEVIKLKERTEKEWPNAKVYTLSGQNGDGLDTWMEAVIKSDAAGTHLAEIDYDTYAEGEAVLGWLNATVLLNSSTADWNVYAKKLLHDLGSRFDAMGAAVGHVKLMIEDDQNYIIGNLTGTIDTLRVRGTVSRKDEVRLTVNARVEMPPKELEKIVMSMLENNCCDNIQYEVQAFKCLQPGRPNPTYRYKEVVG